MTGLLGRMIVLTGITKTAAEIADIFTVIVKPRKEVKSNQNELMFKGNLYLPMSLLREGFNKKTLKVMEFSIKILPPRTQLLWKKKFPTIFFYVFIMFIKLISASI